MSNFKRLTLNVISSLVGKFISILSGLLVSREVLRKYGEELFGLVSSIRNIIGYLGLLEMGLSGSVLYLLYKFFSKGQYAEIKYIYNYLKKRYKFIGNVYMIILLILAGIYSFNSLVFTQSKLNIFFLVITLGSVKAIDFSLVSKYRILLLSDQKDYVNNICSIIQIISFTLLALLIIRNDTSIVFVFAMLAPSNFMRYFLLKYYWKKNYGSKTESTDISSPVIIDQNVSVAKFEVLWLVLSTYVIIVLTFCGSFTEITYFVVQFMIFGNLIMMFQLVNSSISPSYGNILNSDRENFKIKIKQYQHFVFYSPIFVGIIGIISIDYFIEFYIPNQNFRKFIDFDLTMSLFALLCITTIRIFYSSIIGMKGLFSRFRYMTYIILGFLLIASSWPISFKAVHLVWVLVTANLMVIISFLCVTEKFFVSGSQAIILARVSGTLIVVIVMNYMTTHTEFFLPCNIMMMLLIVIFNKSVIKEIYEYINNRFRGFA